jgi:uncharacterized protein YndB with AHSA1/START domain
MTENNNPVTIQAVIVVPVAQVWKLWVTPEDIVNWNHAAENWHSPGAENDLKPGGKFVYRMEAKDGSFGFDFSGIYDEVIPHKLISYTMDDGRKVRVNFSELNGQTTIVETFEPEDANSIELQRNGWQAILDNFKKYAESR